MNDNEEPLVIGGAVDIENGIRWILAVVQRVEVRSGERGLNVHRTGPYSLRKQGSCDVPAFSSAFAPVESGNNGSVKTDRCCVVSASARRKLSRSPRIPGHPQHPRTHPQ